MKFDNIIPLGDHCAASLILKELGLRKKSYPFDWISHKDDFESNINIIVNLLFELLEFNNTCDITNKLLGNKISSNEKIFNELIFPHEFNNVETTNSKYLRRLNRLYTDITNINNVNVYIIITRFYCIPESLFIKLYNKLLHYNNNSHIIIISGVMHNYKYSYSNFDFKYIPYNKNDFYHFDYSKFRPEIKKYLIEKFL